MERVIWGMVGCGEVTEQKNGPGLYKADRSELKGIYSRTYEKAIDYARRHGVSLVYKTVQELLSDPDIHAVYIATPPEAHKEYALACIAAGKIPYIEKPMALNFEDCQEIIGAAEKKGIPIYVAFYRRGAAKFLKIKELIDNGAIGTVYCVDVRQIEPPGSETFNRENLPWKLGSLQGGGYILDRGVHIIDYLMLFFGEITEIRGVVENRAGLYDVEDTVSFSLRFKNNVVGNGLWCYVANHVEDKVTVIGEKGRLEFSGLQCGGNITLVQGVKTTVINFDEPEHVGQGMIQAIVDELTGKSKCLADVNCAAKVTWVMDTLLDEYRKRNK